MNSKYYWVIGILVVLLLGFYFFNSRELPVTNYPSRGSDIIAFGDSLVKGVGASSEDKSFVSLLEEQIGMPIVNLGKSGDTTANGIARLSELDEYNPKIVILLLGGNDHLRKVPIDQTFQNLSTLIENIQSRGAIVLLLGVRGNLLSDKFRPEFKKLHEKYHTAYVEDVLGGLFGDKKYMSDTVHPNDAGYAKIAERIYPVLSKLIE